MTHHQQTDPDPRIRISVVVPTFDRRDSVVRLLHSLDYANFEDSFEVIVVIDGSTDGTAEALASLPVKVLTQERSGTAAARNRGAASSDGDWILFLDDDIVLQPGYLAALTQAVVRDDADIILTRLDIGEWVPDSLLAHEARSWLEDEHRVLTAGRTRPDDVLFAATAVRRATFENAGGFDEAFTAGGAYGNEDIELGYRLLQAEARVQYCPSAVADTDVAIDARLALDREYQVGRNDVALVRKHPDLASLRFGEKLEISHIHRAMAPLVLRTPLGYTLLVPLRAMARAAARARGHLAYRVWFTMKALCYWSGVKAEGGRTIVDDVRRNRG